MPDLSLSLSFHLQVLHQALYLLNPCNGLEVARTARLHQGQVPAATSQAGLGKSKRIARIDRGRFSGRQLRGLCRALRLCGGTCVGAALLFRLLRDTFALGGFGRSLRTRRSLRRRLVLLALRLRLNQRTFRRNLSKSVRRPRHAAAATCAPRMPRHRLRRRQQPRTRTRESSSADVGAACGGYQPQLSLLARLLKQGQVALGCHTAGNRTARDRPGAQPDRPHSPVVPRLPDG